MQRLHVFEKIWNRLPSDVKNSQSEDIFKGNLEFSGFGNYWEISDEILNHIEAESYLEYKIRHNEF